MHSGSGNGRRIVRTSFVPVPGQIRDSSGKASGKSWIFPGSFLHLCLIWYEQGTDKVRATLGKGSDGNCRKAGAENVTFWKELSLK